VERLEQRQVGLKSLKEALDTTSSGGRLIFHMFGALAEFERDLIRERTQAGLSAPRARGRLGRRPKLLTPEKRRLAVQLYRAKEHSIVEICRLMGISKPTLDRYRRR
jgi:DNA invertase Pin-like site-specific DNA recombinase